MDFSILVVNQYMCQLLLLLDAFFLSHLVVIFSKIQIFYHLHVKANICNHEKQSLNNVSNFHLFGLFLLFFSSFLLFSLVAHAVCKENLHCSCESQLFNCVKMSSFLSNTIISKTFEKFRCSIFFL